MWSRSGVLGWYYLIPLGRRDVRVKEQCAFGELMRIYEGLKDEKKDY